MIITAVKYIELFISLASPKRERKCYGTLRYVLYVLAAVNYYTRAAIPRNGAFEHGELKVSGSDSAAENNGRAAGKRTGPRRVEVLGCFLS